MLERQELHALAKFNGLRPWQQEKHYVQAVLLAILAEHPLVLKGGTYLWFFHGLRRFSEDLDFTATAALPAGLAESVSRSLERFGISNRLKIISDSPASFSFRIAAEGPLHTADIDLCQVYIEISKREPVLEKPIPLRLDIPAYQLPVKRLAGMALDEVAAEKIRAILTREKPRDLYDLWHLVTNKRPVFRERLANAKLAYYRKRFSSRTLLARARKLSPAYKRELPSLVLDDLPDFDAVLAALSAWAGKATKRRSP